MSSQSFADLGVSRPVVRALSARGIEQPFPVQRLVVPDVLEGHDVLAKSPTGSGKTLAFGIPIVDRLEAEGPRPGALVLVPTRELASQIVDELADVATARALAITAVYGGAGIQRQSKAARRSHILVATPGRLEDLIERGAVSLKQVSILVLDEADRMLDMGFRPAVDRIVGQTPNRRQTLFFSATLHGEVGKLADHYTSNARRHEHTPPAQRRPDVKHRFLRVRHEDKLHTLVRELNHEGGGPTLVFVRTKRGADRLVKRLRNHDVTALAMHGNKSQSQREKALARFERGSVDTLVATDVAARGLDVDGITHVINFDAPEDRDGYVHRVGRTGRAGRTGTGTTFVLPDQANDMSRIARSLSLNADSLNAVFERWGSRARGRRR
jgi:ATP-dependent RNA helicase RhlE